MYTIKQAQTAIEFLMLVGNCYEVEEQGVSETDMTCLFVLPCQTEIFAGVELVEALVKGEEKNIPTYYFDGEEYCHYGCYSLDELVAIEIEENNFTEDEALLAVEILNSLEKSNAETLSWGVHYIITTQLIDMLKGNRTSINVYDEAGLYGEISADVYIGALEGETYFLYQYDNDMNELQIGSFADLQQAKKAKQELNDQNEHFYFEVELVVDGVRTGTIA